MSNFKPSTYRLSRPGTAVLPLQPPPPMPVPSAQKAATTRPVAIPNQSVSSVQKIGFFLLCMYLLASLANDFSQRMFGSRAYFSIIAGALLPLAVMASGQIFRSLKVNIGRWWAAFLVWMILCIPFSFWVGGSFDLFSAYATKDYPILLYISATVLTFSQIRRLMDVLGVGAIIVIVSCVLYGSEADGRFRIQDSIFFDNANDLAFQLLMSMGVFTYWMLSRQRLKKILGLALFPAAAIYELKTGSRGTFIALVACVFTGIVVFRKHINVPALVVIFGLIAAATPFWVSSGQLTRLTKIQLGSTNVTDADSGSQEERTRIFKRGLEFTVTHPIFGIGPGQFEDYMWKEAKDRGVNVASLKSHDTYVQISSEMGIPGFIIYLATLFASLGLSLRVFKLASKHPQHQDLRNIAFCVFIMLVGYAVGSTFNHMGYSRHLPTLGGLSIALWLYASQVQPAFRIAGAPQTRF